MDRATTVHLTEPDASNLNRLRVPEFAVINLCVKKGGKSSKAYLRQDSPIAPAAGGSDDFHFAPEKENVTIAYEILDVGAVIDKAELQLFTRFNDAPLWHIDLAKLGADWCAHGKHEIDWDGRLPAQPAAEQKGTVSGELMRHDLTKFAPAPVEDVHPDGYVTLEHTPYKLRLVVSSGKLAGNPTAAWTYFHILIKKIELVLGPEEAIPAATVDDAKHKLDKAVRRKLEADGGLPAKGAAKPRKVFLVSNLYKTAIAEMDDDTGFTVYRDLWGDGPNIPVLAKIRLAASDDSEVKLESDKGAVALGKVKFLWDWEDVAEDVDGQGSQPKPTAFIKAAINYYKDGTDARSAAKNHTYPKGDNCHVDRGGKRGPDAHAAFPPQAGYAAKDALDAGKFPFKVEACSTRKWGAFSQAWRKGKLKGHTGVVFQAARMAGDSCKIAVYLAYDKLASGKIALDEKHEPLKAADALKQETGTLQQWREIHLARYIRKKAGIVAFLPAKVGDVQGLYSHAYIRVEDKMTAADQYLLSEHRKANGSAIDYNAVCEAALTATGNSLFTHQLATQSGADHASVDSMILVRGYTDFVTALHVALDPAGAGDFAQPPAPRDLGTAVLPPIDPAWSAAKQARAARLAATQTWLTTGGLETPVKYGRGLDGIFLGFSEKLASDLKLISGVKHGVNAAAKEGITVLHFTYTNTYLRDLNAADPSIGGFLGVAIDVADGSRSKCAFLFFVPMLDTFVHEIGHHLFMPHAPNAGGFVADRHDDADANCMMSYNRPRLAFCGLCQLRLRGWSALALKKTAAQNKKP